MVSTRLTTVRCLPVCGRLESAAAALAALAAVAVAVAVVGTVVVGRVTGLGSSCATGLPLASGRGRGVAVVVVVGEAAQRLEDLDGQRRRLLNLLTQREQAGAACNHLLAQVLGRGQQTCSCLVQTEKQNHSRHKAP